MTLIGGRTVITTNPSRTTRKNQRLAQLKKSKFGLAYRYGLKDRPKPGIRSSRFTPGPTSPGDLMPPTQKSSPDTH